MTAALDLRLRALEQAFVTIAETRMAGLPILNAALSVETLGFEIEADAEAAIGVLITPWFMNLIWLPIMRSEALAPSGAGTIRTVGSEQFEFIAAHEEAIGAYALCSLFSPMSEFSDQTSARTMAQAILDTLRQPPAPPARPALDRRAFLFGRSPTGAVP